MAGREKNKVLVMQRPLLVILVLVAWCSTTTTASGINDEDNAVLPDPETEEYFEEEYVNNFDTGTDLPLQCPTFCKRSQHDRQWFEPGRRYEYEYYASASVAVEGTTAGPRLILRATAHIDALTQCQLRLNLSNAQLELESAGADVGEPGIKRRPLRASLLEGDLSRRPLVFTFANGRIEALCPAADEPLWALNVKRGLLSALQSSGRSVGKKEDVVYERDVSGLCPTKYKWTPGLRWFSYHTPAGNESEYSFFREKECDPYSQTYLTLPSGAPATDFSPISKAVVCRQRFAGNILREVDCLEFQNLDLFSDRVESEGATAEAPLTLEFKKMSNLPEGNAIDTSAPTGPRTSLQFEAEPVAEEEETESVAGDATVLIALVQQLAAMTEDPSAPQGDEDAAALLRRLSVALRRSDFAALQKLFTHVENQPASRRLVLEVLPSARSHAAAALVTRLAADRRLKPEEVDAWLTSRALRVAPSDHELLALTPLVEAWSSRSRVLLAAGALVYSRCTAAMSTAGGKYTCARGSPAATIVAMLEKPLGTRCHLAAGDEDSVFTALRSLGNAGYFSKRIHSKLTHCYQNPQNPLPLRLAAVDALRRSPCADVNPQPLLRIFTSRRADTELRIASYLTSFRCTSSATIRAAREVLRTEDLGQVTSFVWSHLRNIMKSSLTWKTDISHFMEDGFLKDKFSVESLKYSKNHRTSLDGILHAAEVESNTIFSRDSYLPRSASVNLTVQLFRQPISLLEIGGRMEGFEKMLEDFFGPKGYYPDASLHKVLTSLKGKRDVVEMEQSLQRMRTAFGEATDKRLHPEPRADVFARVFGQEVAFASLHDAPQVVNKLREGDPIAAALRALFADGALDVTKAMLLDEAKYTFPTIVGFPVTLSLGASALVRLRAQGNWSSDGPPGSIRAEASLSPSAALAVDASMMVGPVAGPRVGVRLRQRARVASHTGAGMEFQGMRLARLELRAPTRTLQLLDASSTLLLVEDGEEQPARLEPHLRLKNVSMCSGGTLERVLGIRTCANVSYSNKLLGFPLSGPAAVRLQVSKTDDFDKYETQWELEADENGAQGLKVSFDTPGSSMDRTVRVEARADAVGPSFHLRVRSPAGGAEASASVSRNDSAASADVRLAVDGAELLRVAAALRWERPEHGPDALRLRPELDAQAAGGTPLRLAGELGLMPGARYHAHVVLRGSGEPVKLQGELRLRDAGYEVLGEVSCPLLNGSLSGNVTAEPGVCASDLRVEYTTASGQQHTAVWSHSYEAGASSLALNASTELSEFPAASARLQWTLRRDLALWEHRLRWERAQHVWKAIQRLRTLRRGPLTHLHALAALTCPQRRIDYKLDLEHQVEEGNSSTRGEVLLGWKQRYAAAVQFSRAPGPRVELNAEASTPSVRAEVRGRIAKKKHLQGELEGVLILPRGRSHLALTGTYKQEGGLGAGPPGAQVHRLQLQLVGALRGEMQAHVSLGADGVEHALRLKTGTIAVDASPSYAHFFNYHTNEGRHLVDAIISIGGQNFSGSVEAILNNEDESIVVRLPFSSQIILSSKWHGSKFISGEYDQEYFDVEISWDKHLFPKNYVSFNYSKNGSYSRRVLDYPNQNIFGEVVNQPGYLSLEMRWDKENENRKIKSKANWNFEPNKGTVSAWVNTPFRALKKQSIDVSYSNDAEEFQLQMSAKALDEEQQLNATWRRDPSSGNVRASLEADGTLTSPLQVKLQHEPRGRTFISAIGVIADAQMNISRSASDGSISALSASSRVWPFPACSLDVAHADNERRGALRCEDAFELSFRAADDRPFAAFKAALQRFGHARSHFNFVGNNKTAIFETGTTKQPRFFAVGLEHYQQSKNNFTLKLDTQWKERGLHGLFSSFDGREQTKFHGTISGDLDLQVTHVRHHLSQYPHDFLTLISLPGKIRLNHTFQGKNLMNWMSKIDMKTPYREGLLKVEQAVNPSSFYHQVVAETIPIRQHNNGETIERRRVGALVRVDLDDDAPLGVKLVEASLQPPGNADALSLTWTAVSDEYVLTLKYPPHALALRVDTAHDDDGYFAKGILEIPGTAPLEVKTLIKINQEIFAEVKGRWGNQTLDIESMLFTVPGTTTAYIHSQHSTYGEIVRFDYNQKFSLYEANVKAQARYFDREIKLAAQQRNNPMGTFEEWKLNLTSPFDKWKTVDGTLRFDLESEIPEVSFKAQRNDEEMGLTLKSNLPLKDSILNMNYGSFRFWIRDDYVTAFVDRRDVENQKLEGQLMLGGKTAECKGAVTSRRNGALWSGGSIQAVLKTWFIDLQHAEMLVNYTNSEQHELEIFLKQDEWMLKVNGSSKFDRETSFASLNVFLPHTSPVRNITGKLNYQKQSSNDHQMVMSAVCDGQVLETNVSLAASDGELAAFLDTRNSLLGYGPLTARFNLAGTLATNKTLLFELTAGQGQVNLSGWLSAPSILHVKGQLTARYGSLGFLTAGLRYDLSGEEDGRRHALFQVILPDSDAHALSAEVLSSEGCRCLNASMTLSAPRIGILRASAAYDAKEVGAVYANAEVVSGIGDDERRFLDVALSLRDSILSAQMVAEPLGLRVLSISSGWAERDPRRYARIHVHVAGLRELRAEANAQHDLNMCEVVLQLSDSATSDEMTTRLHAKYEDTRTLRNITAVLVHARETRTLTASLERRDDRQNGDAADTRAEVYLAATSLGRMRVVADVRKEKGSILELFMDDNNLDPILHSRASLEKKKVDLFIESRRADFRKLNFSLEMDVYPIFNHTSFYLEHLAGRSYLPSTVAARLGRTGSFFKLDNNYVMEKHIPRNIELKILHEKLFESPINPSYDLILSLNRSEVLRSSAKFVIDLEKVVEMNTKINSNIHGKKWKMGVEVRYKRKTPASLELKVTDQTGTIFELTESHEFKENGDFSYSASLSSHYGRQRHSAELEYTAAAFTRVILDVNSTVGVDTSRYYASLSYDPSRELILEIWTPIKGFEHFDLRAQREIDKLTLDLFASYPGLNVVSLRGEAYLREDVREKIGYIIPVKGYPLRLKDLRNATLQLEVLREDGQGVGIDGAYDVSGTKRTVRMTLSGADGGPFTISGYWEPFAKKSLNAGFEVVHPKHLSLIHVHISSDKILFKTIFMNENIADFKMLLNSLNISPILQIDFRSSFMEHPLTVVYDFSTLTDRSRIRRVKIRVEIQAFGKPITISFNSQSDTYHIKYNVKLSVLDKTGNFEILFKNQEIQGKIKVVGPDGELLQTNIRSNTSMLRDGFATFSLLQGKSFFWESDYDFRGDHKHIGSFVEKFGERVFHGRVTAKSVGEKRFEEITGNVVAPVVNLNQALFKYTWEKRDTSKSLDESDGEHVVHMLWRTVSQETSAHMNIDIGDRNKTLNISVQKDQNDILTMLCNFYSTQDQNVGNKHLYILLNYMDSKWLLSGSSKRENDIPVRNSIEIITPRKELQRFILITDTKHGFSLDFNTTIANKNSSLVLKYDKHSLSGTLISPHKPVFHIDVYTEFDSASNMGNISTYIQYGTERVLVLGNVSVKDQEAYLRLHFDPSWMSHFSIIAENGVNGSNFKIFASDELIVGGEMIHRIDPRLDMNMTLAVNIRNKPMHVSARYSSEQDKGPLRLGNFEWITTASLLKCVFKFNDSIDDGHPEIDASFDFKVNEPIVSSTLKGVWPKSGEVRVLMGKNEEEYKISYTSDQSEDSAHGKFIIRTPFAQPLEVSLSFEHDPITKLQKVTANTQGYGATVSWNLSNRKELITEIVMPLKKNISARGSFIDHQINLYASWPNGDTTATFICALDLSTEGSFILSTPWELDFIATWMGEDNPRGEMVITVNSIRISAVATFQEHSKHLNVTSPWYTVWMKRMKTQNGHSLFEGTVRNVRDGLSVALWRFEIGPVTRLSLNVWDGVYSATSRDGVMDIFADNSYLRLEARTNFSSSGVLQEVFLNTNSSLNRVQARWQNSGGSFNLDAEVPKFNNNLRVYVELEDNQFLINYKSPLLELSAEASHTSEKTLWLTNVRAVEFGSSRLEMKRLERSVLFVVEVENVAGKRLGAQSSANWGPGELHLEAAAGDWTADLTALSAPPRLEANWRNASLKVQLGEVRLVMMDGSEHSVFWTLDLSNAAVHGRVQVDSPVMLPEHVALQLDFKHSPRIEGMVARILLERGKQRHSVELNFSPSSLEKMRMSAKADDREVMSVGYALMWQKDLMNASMHLTLRDQENYLELSHRRAFPFASSVSARAPWLLRGERVSARVATDARSLDAQVSLGEGAACRDAVLRGRLQDASTTLSFQCSFEGSPVLDFALGAAIQGSLEDADVTATADTRLLTSDGAALYAAASAALTAHSLGSNLTFVTQSQSRNSSYNMGFLLPLSLSEDTKMAAWLMDPSFNYTFIADLQNTNSSIRVDVSLHTPNITSTASILTQRQPFTLNAAVTCSAREFHHYAVRLNTPVENGAGRAYAFEWGEDPKRVELRHRFVLGEASIAAAVELNTPFRGLDRCALQVAYENGERKLAMARVHYPGLDRDLGLELDYRARGLSNASVRVAFHSPSDIPSFIPRLRSAELMLVHVLDTASEDKLTYRFELRGEVNGREADAVLGMEVSVADVPRTLLVLFDATQDGRDILRVRAAAQSRDFYDRQVYNVEVHSISEHLRHFKTVVDLSPSRVHILSKHNDLRYIDLLAIRVSSKQINVTLINPFQSVFVSVTRRFGSDLKLAFEVGLERQVSDGESTFDPVLGFGVHRVENFGGTRVNWSAWAHTSGPEVRFESAWEEGSTVWERRMYVLWEGRHKAVGYHMVMQRGGVDGAWKREVGAQVGDRAVQLRARGSPYSQEAELLWDATRDEKERAAIALRAGTPDGWELKLEHPLLGDGARLAVNAHLEAEGRELRAGATVTLALLMEHGVNWRASAALQVVPRTSDPEDDGGRAVVSLRLQDRVEGRDLSAELRAEMGQEEAMEVPNGAAVAFALNVTYVPGTSAVWRTLLSEIRASPRLLLLHTRTPEAEVTLRARSWDLGAELLARADQHDALRLQIVAEPDTRSMAAEVELSGRDFFRLQMAAPHRRLVVADVFHKVPYGGHLQPLVRVKASLPTPRLFQAKADWTSGKGWKNAMDSGQLLRREVERVPSAMRAAADAHARLWREQWDAKIPWPAQIEWRAFVSGRANDVARDVKKTMVALLETKVSINVSALGIMDVTLDGAGETAHALWEEMSNCTNALVKSTLQWGSEIASVLRDCLNVIEDAVQADVLLSALGDALSHFRTQMLLARAAVLERAAALLDSVGNALEDAAQMAAKAAGNVTTRVVNPLTEYMWMSVDAMTHAIFEIVFRVEVLWGDIVGGFLDVTEIRRLMDLVSEAMRWLKGPFNEYLEEFADYVFEVVELVLCDLEQSLRLLWEKVQRMAPNLPSALRDLYYQLLVLWEQSGASIIAGKMDEWGRMAELESESPTIRYTPDAGHLLVRQHLPVDWEGFDKLPRFDQLRRPILLKEDDSGDSSLSTRDIIDMVNDLASQTPRTLLERGVSYVLPSFSATAQLVGSSHVITFDGNAYAVDGDCSYLLSGDLVHNTFAIVVHFTSQSSSGRSFTMVTPEHHIFVNKDYVVRVDGMVLDLPARHLDLLDVHRTEDAVEVTVPGATFRCHVRSHVCTVHVSGWNFGHVAGLLGSFDRERADDLDAVPGMQVDGSRGHRVWRVGRCKASNRSPSEFPNMADMTVAPACEQMFVDSLSVLSVCHSAVDPSPYAALCSALGPCHASQAYSEACRLKIPVQIKVPLECGSCVGPDGGWLSTGGVAPSAGPQTDVSLVVQRSCGRRGGLQRTTDMASHLASALSQRGVQNTRFAIVAFGGSEGAVLQAPAGRVWTDDPKALQKMIIRLQQSGGSAGGVVAPGDAEAAVGAASALRSRAGAGRAVVLVHCGVCARDAFAQLAAPLEAAGAPLHVLRPGALNSPVASGGKAARALGASGKGLAFSTQRYDIQTPEGLLAEKAIAQAVVAKDACTAAALESGGSVFDSARMTGAGQPSSKRFMDAWAEEVARSIRPSTCTRFRCATEGQAVCAAQETSPQNSEEADEQFMQFLQ